MGSERRRAVVSCDFRASILPITKVTVEGR